MASDPSLYDSDVLAWSEQQAALLHRLARGERIHGVDWENVIEEVESVGRSELNAVRSNLRLALLHALKLAAWPDSPARAHWEGELTAFLVNAQTRFEPGMRQRLDLARLYAQALRDLDGLSDATARRPVPGEAPDDLADALTGDLAPRDLVARLSRPG